MKIKCTLNGNPRGSLIQGQSRFTVIRCS